MMVATFPPPPGIYHDIADADYRDWPAWSQSTIKRGRLSMLHAKHAYDYPIETTDAMRLGSAVHVAFLEPEQIPERVTVYKGRRAGADWCAFSGDNADKLILTETQHAAFRGMVRALRANSVVRQWLGRMDGVEVSALKIINEVNVKGRCDALTADPLMDVKTTLSVEPRQFERTAYNLGYHIQAGLYCDLFQRERFVFLAVESAPPHDVVPYECSEDFIAAGKCEYLSLLKRIRKCEKSGRWPGVLDTDNEYWPLDLPAWAKDQPTLKIGATQ